MVRSISIIPFAHFIAGNFVKLKVFFSVGDYACVVAYKFNPSIGDCQW
jgi:hypothetical protein